jgi:Protein of unknown function (DUF1553)/Protein of unknown function (DUF1549)/Planctomycete cytochrome C
MSWVNCKRLLLTGGLCVLPVLSLFGAATEADGLAFFERHIRPLLAERCYECHGAASATAAGGLRLDTREGLLRGGVSGPAIVVRQPDVSPLIRTLRAHATSIVPHHLSSPELAALIQWVQLGTPDPRTGEVQDSTSKVQSSNHWAFKPLRASSPPAVRNPRWPQTSVDSFILARLESAGLQPALAAEKRALLRRATFDLIGLPPTLAELKDFLHDRTSGAFGRVVERLLASPRYGERWGRHWLDVARYADTAGDTSDFPIPQAWRYRNWVIDAFNRDLPYDQFLREQLAGDLLPADSQARRNNQTIATGFLVTARRFSVGEPASKHLTIEDTLDTTSRAVLGLSLSCARCHDHKYDPISMEDYYSLYGIFDSTRYPHPGSEPEPRPSGFVPLIPRGEYDALVLSHEQKVRENDAEIARIEKQMNALQAEGFKTGDLQKEFDAAWSRRDALAESAPKVEMAYAASDGLITNAQVQLRGEPLHAQGPAMTRRFLKLFGGRALPAGCTNSGRLELARWLTEDARDLTARVMVNRIWQHHFGRGLVATPSDFGTRGEPPSHPELLDWLAARFIDSGWSIKAMHRLIVFSAAYQQSSVAENPRAEELDPKNALLWRFNRQRLDAEQIRDALLFVSGMMDLEPGESHPFPPEDSWKFTQHFPFTANYHTDKRSVYLMRQRIVRQPLLALFDGADPSVSTATRPDTTTPLQALFAMNDKFIHAQAGAFAARLLAAPGCDREHVDLACQLAFGRPARPDEIREALEYLARAETQLASPDSSSDARRLAAWSSYARVLMGSNEFNFID